MRTELVMDEHLKLVADFMRENLPVAKRVAVANALPDLAKLLWDRPNWPKEEIVPLDILSFLS